MIYPYKIASVNTEKIPHGTCTAPALHQNGMARYEDRMTVY